jgi:hypothetical protein
VRPCGGTRRPSRPLCHSLILENDRTQNSLTVLAFLHLGDQPLSALFGRGCLAPDVFILAVRWRDTVARLFISMAIIPCPGERRDG